MLAFVFWHWSEQRVTSEQYEKKLIAFHQELAGADLSGFHSSVAFRVSGAPWLAHEGHDYEDWYLVENFAALETLNTGAVAGASQAPHTSIAQDYAGGTSGIYALRVGSDDVGARPTITWLAKPKGMSYVDFYAGLEPWTASGQASLWRRQLVLGPAPEFCISSAERLDLPLSMASIEVTRSVVWDGRRVRR